MIRFACGSCQKSISAPDEKAGMRFLCPGCKSPLEVPSGSAAIQAVRSPAAPMGGDTGVQPPPDIAKVSFGKRVLSEFLAIIGATFRQTLKPITLVFEVQRRRSLRKKAGQAKFALGQRMAESKIGDKNKLVRIKELGERIQNIQDVKGDARQPTAERKKLIAELAEPAMATDKVPPTISGEHEQARTLAAKLKKQEESLAGAFGGLMPPNGVAWRRVMLGYTMTFMMGALVFLIFYQAGAAGRRLREYEAQQAAANRDADEKRKQEDADWATEKKTKDIVKKCGPSVALIQFKINKNIKGGGTGFMIRPGVVVTNAHVVEDALPEDLKVYFPSAKDINKTPYACRILHFDRKRDIAVLAVDTVVPPLRLADNYEFESGTHITMIGCPGALEGKQLENAVTEGTLSTKAEVDKMPYYQLSAAVNPGNSGGPVFDSRGQVIGVVTLKIVKTGVENIAYCIPWKDLRERVEGLEKEDPHKSASVAASFHSLSVIKEHTFLCAQLYSQMANAYANVAIRTRRPLAEVVNALRPKVDETLAKLDGMTMNAKKQALVNRLVEDKNLPDDVREDFRKMIATHDEIKQLFEKPESYGNASAYDRKNRELATRFLTQAAALAKSLGLEPPQKRSDDDE